MTAAQPNQGGVRTFLTTFPTLLTRRGIKRIERADLAFLSR